MKIQPQKNPSAENSTHRTLIRQHNVERKIRNFTTDMRISYALRASDTQQPHRKPALKTRRGNEDIKRSSTEKRGRKKSENETTTMAPLSGVVRKLNRR